jgi:hypothetical protein
MKARKQCLNFNACVENSKATAIDIRGETGQNAEQTSPVIVAANNCNQENNYL